MTVMKIRDDMSPAQLRKLARRERDSRVARRLLGIAAALDGMSREAAAKLAGVGRQVLRDWVVRYNAEGVEGLRDEPRCGRPARLSAEERAGLKAMVLSPPDPSGPSRWRIVDLQQMIETRWGVRYPDSLNIRESPLTGGGGGRIFLLSMIRRGFLDAESWQDLIEIVRDVSALHGLGRRANALVLLDKGWSCAQVSAALMIDDDTVRTWFKIYERDGIDGLMELPWGGNNCRLSVTQQAQLVQAWLNRPDCRIKLHFLPPCCPHLDPIERLWGLAHKHVTHNKCYATFKEFAAAFLTFLREDVPKKCTAFCDTVADNFRIINPRDFRVLG